MDLTLLKDWKDSQDIPYGGDSYSINDIVFFDIVIADDDLEELSQEIETIHESRILIRDLSEKLNKITNFVANLIAIAFLVGGFFLIRFLIRLFF